MTNLTKAKKTTQQKFNLFLVLLIYALFLGLVVYLFKAYHRFGWLGFVGSIIYPDIIISLNKKWNFL